MSLRCVSPPLLYPVSFEKGTTYFSVSYVWNLGIIFVLSLHKLGECSLNGCSSEVVCKTTIFLHFICQTSLCHTWIYTRNSQLFFLTSVSPKIVNSKKKKKFLNPIFTPNKNFMALNFWSYFTSNTLRLVYKTPVSLALCQPLTFFPCSIPSLCYNDSSCHVT